MTMRVAHVNVARAYRGGERQTELLIRELAGRDIEQVLIARRGGRLADRFTDIELGVRRIGGNFVQVALAAGGIDVIHVHEGRSIYGAYLRSLISATPYIATRRVDNPIGDHRAAHAAYRRAACVAAVAPQVADVVRAFDPGVTVEVIHSSTSGLAVDRANAAAIRKSLPGSIVIGHVGALDNDQKAQEHIIAVARDLAATNPELGFVFVGDGEDEAMLKQMAAGLDNAVFTGFVDNVGDYLAAFDIFVLPSRREGIGSILLDAMERGLPVIAARVGGVPAIVEHEVNGLLIDADRPDQLRDAILRLVAAPETWAAMGKRGQAVAEAHRPSVMADRYLDLYERAIA